MALDYCANTTLASDFHWQKQRKPDDYSVLLYTEVLITSWLTESDAIVTCQK